MKMTTSIHVYDPPMCCSTGVCGPSVDPELARFAADLQWAQNQGATVERFNLAQQPGAFAENTTVRSALQEHGNGCLPLVLVNNAVVLMGSYPSREQIASWLGVEPGQGDIVIQGIASSRGDDESLVRLGAKKGGCC
jgi:Arsenical resistance operon protein ArsD